MICKGCLKERDGTGYWRSLFTPHDPTYILCPKCFKGYKDHSKPIEPVNLVDRFNEMKRKKLKATLRPEQGMEIVVEYEMPEEE